ncbi:hypothetical protein MUN78_00390 [Leucobacter allii]|uniref:CarD-like/TRCF RNAP-interacting domain-containing protein n=1 Tax=Leucobacter allii TaxID=2932247 RepID=A0ABY4FM76_9MICO|nr:hypothetical protein [Leucobacter allii]UOQ57338.1 hypothetical protein MUN78_00390 [Leucobacter allii]
MVSTTSRRFPDGATHECLNLEALDTHALAVTIPLDQYAASGLRSVVTGAAVDEVFGTLNGATGEESDNWSRRYKANEQKIRSGSILSLAEVVRDLLRRKEEKHISHGERRTLEQGMTHLAREVYYSKSLDSVGAAEQLIRDAALGESFTR